MQECSREVTIQCYHTLKAHHFVMLTLRFVWHTQHLMFECHFSWQRQHLVLPDCHYWWNAQHVAMFECHFPGARNIWLFIGQRSRDTLGLLILHPQMCSRRVLGGVSCGMGGSDAASAITRLQLRGLASTSWKVHEKRRNGGRATIGVVPHYVDGRASK